MHVVHVSGKAPTLWNGGNLMANRKDVLMTHVVSAFARGCGTAEISDEASGWFYDRYYEWLDTPKNNPAAGGRPPQEVWEENKAGFLDRFRQIGERAAGGGGPVGAAAVQDSALAVENASDCPWCPIQT